MAKRLTERDWRTIQTALNRAMDDRASFAEAYGNQGPEAAQALAMVEQFEQLHVKLFGAPSARQRDLDAMAATPMISIFELGRKD